MNDSTADELRTSEYRDRLVARLVSAQQYLLSGEPAEAVAVWKQMISEGGDIADWGHCEYAAYLYRRDQDDEAQAQLVQLMLGRRVFSAPWYRAAELLEKRGDLEAALFFFANAVSCLAAEQLSDPPVWAERFMAGRRRVRWALEIPLDDTDLLAEIGDAEMDDKSIDLPNLLATPRVVDGRLHFWARDQFKHALCLWPDYVTTEDADQYFRDIERVLRAYAGGRVVAVPRTVGAEHDASDPEIHDARSMAEVLAVVNQMDEGSVVEWPPGRNQVCWCGSGVKYKKCCGGLAVAG